MVDRIEKEIELKGPTERVWRALTDSAQFGTWFKVKLDGSFEVGVPTRGYITHPGYEHLPFEVITVTLEPPRRFAFTWHPFAVNTAVDYSGETPTLVEFHLAPTAGGTHLRVVGSGFDAVPAHRRAEALRMNEGGWGQQTLNIKTYVET